MLSGKMEGKEDGRVLKEGKSATEAGVGADTVTSGMVEASVGKYVVVSSVSLTPPGLF